MSKFDNRPHKKIEDNPGQGTDIYLNSQAAPAKRSSAAASNIDPDDTVRQTYYVTYQQKKALALMAAHEDGKVSEIVRAALNEYIPAEYMRMALMK